MIRLIRRLLILWPPFGAKAGGPYSIGFGQAFCFGPAAGQAFSAGPAAGQTCAPGAAKGQVAA